MARRRFAMLLPGISVIITCGLWLWARAQYLGFVCPPDGICPPDGWPVRWTDYTPITLELAGMLNVPAATFGYPLYHLLHEDTSKWELIALLFGVAVQWSYIGWILDTRDGEPRPRRVLRGVAGAMGLVFGVFILLATIPMYHVGLVYKAVGLVWSFLICRHFLFFLRNSSVAHGH